jgi:thiamine biosynthesis lipoprotein
MKQTQLIMDMPVIVEITDSAKPEMFTEIFDYFRWVDNTFSTFKPSSEISNINKGLIKNYSREMNEIFRLAQQTKKETDGFFDIYNGNIMDPSGIVKGWAIHNAAKKLKQLGIKRFYLEAGGDIEAGGNPSWRIGIRNPFNTREIVKVVAITNMGIATSGSYERGSHIYNPKNHTAADDILSLTVIGPDILDADRFATAAFAMGKKGLAFIDSLPGFEGYMIDNNKIAAMTSGFETFAV